MAYQSPLPEYVCWNGHDDEIRVWIKCQDAENSTWLGVGLTGNDVDDCCCLFLFLCLYKIIRVDKNNNIEHFY